MPIEAAGRGSTGRRRRPVAPWAALLLAVAPLPGAREIPIQELSPLVGSSAPLRLAPDGFGVDVNGWVALFLPIPGAEAVEIDYRATGHVMLSWGSGRGSTAPSPHGAPWHRVALAPGGSGRATLDLRTTSMWSPERVPFLFLEGTGTVFVTAVRARLAGSDPRQAHSSLVPGRLLAPIRIDHLTINTLDPWQEESLGLTLTLLVGTGFVLLSLASAVVIRLRTGTWRPAPAIALAAIAAGLVGNLAFAARMAPAASFAEPTDPTGRLEAWRDFHPELGPLVALARRNVRATETVGVLVNDNDWFGWETVCFYLAPRRCVQIRPGRAESTGLQGTERVQLDQVDVLVVFHPGAPLPGGWVPVASLNGNAFVARRR